MLCGHQGHWEDLGLRPCDRLVHLAGCKAWHSLWRRTTAPAILDCYPFRPVSQLENRTCPQLGLNFWEELNDYSRIVSLIEVSESRLVNQWNVIQIDVSHIQVANACIVI